MKTAASTAIESMAGHPICNSGEVVVTVFFLQSRPPQLRPVFGDDDCINRQLLRLAPYNQLESVGQQGLQHAPHDLPLNGPGRVGWNCAVRGDSLDIVLAGSERFTRVRFERHPARLNPESIRLSDQPAQGNGGGREPSSWEVLHSNAA